MFKDKTSKKRFQNIDITKDLSTLDAMHNKIITSYTKKIIDDKQITDDPEFKSCVGNCEKSSK